MVVRKIIHLDLDAFFCAVEELNKPELRGTPFAVGGHPEGRGVVSSCSYAARVYGVRSAMPISQALRLCPDLIVISSNFAAYGSASNQAVQIIKNLTPLVEQVSIDEAFLDVTDLPQLGLEIAKNLQTTIRNQLDLPSSLGIASNKLIAKIATNFGKSTHSDPTPPNAIQYVPSGEEAAFLAPLPTRALWGVGSKTAARLSELGILTIGDIAKTPEAVLVDHFGKLGHLLAEHARGIDNQPVTPIHKVKSISQEITFEKDIADPFILKRTLQDLSEQVGYRLRKQGLTASTVRIKLRWSDFSTHTRQFTLRQPVDQDSLISATAKDLFDQLWQPHRKVRLLGVGASGLASCAHQLSLWDTPGDKERRLLEAIDNLKERFGNQIVQKGRSLRSSKQ